MNFIPLQVTFQSSKIKFYLCISSQLWLLSYHTVFIPYLELEIQKEFGKRDCRQWFSKSKDSITYLETFEIEGAQKKSRMAQNFAINKKSTIVVQSLWNLVKIFISWVLYVARISAGLDQNCGFFTNSKVLGQSG